MPYSGHVEKGVVVLDDAVKLGEGTRVQIEVVGSAPRPAPSTPLRGSDYSFDDPFGPALSESEWNAVR